MHQEARTGLPFAEVVAALPLPVDTTRRPYQRDEPGTVAMEHPYVCDVSRSAEGLASIQIIDTTGTQPTLFLVERSPDERVVWFGPEGRAFALTQDQVLEVLPFLLNFLEAGRLVNR